MQNDDLFLEARLASQQIETLWLVYNHMNSKQIARELNVSPHTVDQRIRQSMKILGVDSRTAAARKLASAGRFSEYQPLIYQASDIEVNRVSPDENVEPRRKVSTSQFSIGWPFPTPAQPTNLHGLKERLVWPILIAIATILGFAALYSVMVGLGRILSR